MENYSDFLMRIGGDTGNHPHYTKGRVQPIDLIMSLNMSFPEGCIIKLISRYKEKEGLTDLYEARNYIEVLIKEYEEHQRMMSAAIGTKVEADAIPHAKPRLRLIASSKTAGNIFDAWKEAGRTPKDE